MRNLILFTSLVAGLLGAAPTRAELVGTGFKSINRTDVFVIELSSQQRPEVGPAGPCEKFGQFMALVTVGSTSIAPRTLPYAAGCWVYTGSTVRVTAERLKDRKPISIELSLSDIETAEGFKSWSQYRLRQR